MDCLLFKDLLHSIMQECFPACVCTMCVQCPRWSGEGIGSPGTGVTGACEPPCRDLELSLAPLEEQSVPLTDELSFQPHTGFLVGPGDQSQGSPASQQAL